MGVSHDTSDASKSAGIPRQRPNGLPFIAEAARVTFMKNGVERKILGGLTNLNLGHSWAKVAFP